MYEGAYAMLERRTCLLAGHAICREAAVWIPLRGLATCTARNSQVYADNEVCTVNGFEAITRLFAAGLGTNVRLTSEICAVGRIGFGRTTNDVQF